MNLSSDAELFDKLRKVRNGINYYGREVSVEEADYLIEKLMFLINKFKK